MSAETTYYVKVPVVHYEWIKVQAITADEALLKHPTGVDVLHWSQVEIEDDTGRC